MEKPLKELLQEFQEACENLRATGRSGALSAKSVTKGLRRLEANYTTRILTLGGGA